MLKYIFLLFVLTFLFSCQREGNGKMPKNVRSAAALLSDSLALVLTNNIKSDLISTSCPGAAISFVLYGENANDILHGLQQNQRSKDTIDQNSLFRIGSLSKGFSGILASILVEQGYFRLDDAVADYIDNFGLKAKSKSDTIRIWHLLSHATGLTEHAYSNLIEQHKDKATIVKAISNGQVRDSTGKAYAYQNACFSLIEEIVQKTTGLSYEVALDHFIFGPLKMDDSSVGYNELMTAYNKALPHKFANNGYQSFIPDESYYNTPSAGGVNSNLHDMKKWMTHLGSGQHSYFSNAILNRAFEPRINTSFDDKYFNSFSLVDSSYYGLGWRILFVKGRKIIFHGGQVNQYRCEIAFDPLTKSGIVALFNSTCEYTNQVVPRFLEFIFANPLPDQSMNL